MSFNVSSEQYTDLFSEISRIEKRIENEHLKAMREVNTALDQVKDAAQLVQRVESELMRLLNLYEGIDIRLQEVEAQFGW